MIPSDSPGSLSFGFHSLVRRLSRPIASRLLGISRAAVLALLLVLATSSSTASETDRLSPDGTLVARTVAGTGGSGEALSILARAGGTEIAAWRSPGLIEAAWAPDSRGLAVFDHRASGSVALLFVVQPGPSGGSPSIRLHATSLGGGATTRWFSSSWNAENRQVSLRGLGPDDAPARRTLALESDPIACLKAVPGVEPAAFGWGSVVAEGEECPVAPPLAASAAPAPAAPKACCAEKKPECASGEAEKPCCAEKPATTEPSAPTAAAPAAPPAPEADPAIGRWEGQWFFKVGQRLVPGGKMGCLVERTGPDAWKATFEAEWGKTKDREAQAGIWKVSLDGRREDGKIVFGGDVDLGAASGGVFNWNGSIDGDSFDGEYRSKMVNGSFQMKRAVEGAEAKGSPESSPDATPAEAPSNETAG